MSERAQAGFLNINKPLRWTSHDVVARVRRLYRTITDSAKVGHAGTLDPLADGVLVVCLGRATRLSDTIMRGEKIYRARISFGRSTSTYDAAGEILSERDTKQLSLAQIKRALPQFVGEISQLPPLYSAVKVGGQKLYQYARRGEAVTRPARLVTVHAIEIESWSNPLLTLDVHCGAGTYIRSLAHDLGEALDVGAHLAGLTRRASGAFTLAESVALEDLLRDDDWRRHIVTPFEALRGHTRLTLTAEEIEAVMHGRFIDARDGFDDEQVFAFDSRQRLVAILTPRADRWKPRKVFWKQS